jgi:hypothetical protein
MGPVPTHARYTPAYTRTRGIDGGVGSCAHFARVVVMCRHGTSTHSITTYTSHGIDSEMTVSLYLCRVTGAIRASMPSGEAASQRHGHAHHCNYHRRYMLQKSPLFDRVLVSMSRSRAVAVYRTRGRVRVATSCASGAAQGVPSDQAP